MQKPSDLKFVFFGTPDVASETLEILKLHGYVPYLIVTSPDRPVGRHFTMTPSPVKTWAIAHQIPFVQPEKIVPDFFENLKEYTADLFIVVAYGKILPQALIDIPKLGTLNIHYSLLPRWRGASPVEAAILAGDSETGVSIQNMVFKLDAGPVIAEARIPIELDDTTPSLRGKLIPLGANLLAKVLLEKFLPCEGEVARGSDCRNHLRGASDGGVEQIESFMTHCGKTKKEDGLVDLIHDDPEILWRKYRAYQPWPGLYFFKDGKRIKITRAKLENNKFIVEKVIREGEKESDYFN